MATRGVSQPEIELLTFENHTECRCVLKSSLSSNSDAYRIENSPLPNDEPPRRLNNNQDSVRRVVTASVPERTTTELIITTTTESTVNCRCPNHFTQINRSECKCDCPIGQSRSTDMCIKLKTGIEHFSIIERRQVHKNTFILWFQIRNRVNDELQFYFFVSLMLVQMYFDGVMCKTNMCVWWIWR